jgi:membrane fusion protein, adhesin transport system
MMMSIMSRYSETRRMEAAGVVKASRMVRTPKVIMLLSVWLIVLVIASVILLGFMPWQQTVTGKGEVTTLNPMNRPQTIEAPIDGIVSQWLVKEGDHVTVGQPLLELDEIKTEYLDESQLERYMAQREAQEYTINAAMETINALQAQQQALQASRGFAVPGAQAKANAATAKVNAANQKVQAAVKNLEIAQLNETRVRALYAEGLKSKRELELAENALVKARTDKEGAQADVSQAQREQDAAGFEVGKADVDVESKVQETASKLAKAQQDYAKANNDLVKLDNDIQNLMARQDQRIIRAKSEGTLVRANILGPGQTVKPGDPLAIVVSSNAVDRSVALFLSDVDAPLVKPGDPVRLQFAGFPAVQFSGWPMVAVGTFAGRVVVVDAVDDGLNRFRVLVEADAAAIAAGKEQPWPKETNLRYGTQAIGWVMLQQVPLGYELWRRFNGFQLSLEKAPGVSNTGLNILDPAGSESKSAPKEEKTSSSSKSFGNLKTNAGKVK